MNNLDLVKILRAANLTSNPEYCADGAPSPRYQRELDREDSVEDWLTNTANQLLRGETIKAGKYDWNMENVLEEVDQELLAANLIALRRADDNLDKLDAVANLFADVLEPAARIVAARILPKVILEQA